MRSDVEIKIFLINYVRVVQRDPVHVDGHAHTFKALQVPPLEHTGEQTPDKAQKLHIDQFPFQILHTCGAS